MLVFIVCVKYKCITVAGTGVLERRLIFFRVNPVTSARNRVPYD